MLLEGFHDQVGHQALAFGVLLFLQFQHQDGFLALGTLVEILVKGGDALSVFQQFVFDECVRVGLDFLAVDGRVVVHNHHVIRGKVYVEFTAPAAEILRLLERGDGILGAAGFGAIPIAAVGGNGDFVLGASCRWEEECKEEGCKKNAFHTYLYLVTLISSSKVSFEPSS